MKSILITGANGGMGGVVTDYFAKRGYRVYAVDRILCPERANVIPLQADLTDKESVAAVYEAVRADTSELSGIIHLAGIYLLNSLVEIPSADFERAFRVNLGGVFEVNKAFRPLLKKGARIIMVTSELAVRDPLPFTGLYGITKTALDKYAYSLRMELQLLGIKVSVLRAGAVDTGMLGESTRQLDAFCDNTEIYTCNAKRFRQIVEHVEARRIPPERIAAKLYSIYRRRNPRFAYSINRNPLLILLDLLPRWARFFIIRNILKTPNSKS